MEHSRLERFSTLQVQQTVIHTCSINPDPSKYSQIPCMIFIIFLACHCDNYDVAAQCILCNDRHQFKYHVKIRIISLRFYYKLVHFT